jgi:hypothetical protein
MRPRRTPSPKTWCSSSYHTGPHACVKFRAKKRHGGEEHAGENGRGLAKKIASRAHTHLSSLHVLTRAQRTRVHLFPQHRLTCHFGLYKFEFEFEQEMPVARARVSGTRMKWFNHLNILSCGRRVIRAGSGRLRSRYICFGRLLQYTKIGSAATQLQHEKSNSADVQPAE